MERAAQGPWELVEVCACWGGEGGLSKGQWNWLITISLRTEGHGLRRSPTTGASPCGKVLESCLDPATSGTPYACLIQFFAYCLSVWCAIVFQIYLGLPLFRCTVFYACIEHQCYVKEGIILLTLKCQCEKFRLHFQHFYLKWKTFFFIK